MGAGGSARARDLPRGLLSGSGIKRAENALPVSVCEKATFPAWQSLTRCGISQLCATIKTLCDPRGNMAFYTAHIAELGYN